MTPDRISVSPFSDPSPPTGQGVVIHATRSGKSMNPAELEGTLSWFKNPVARVSSHWVIGRDGTTVRVIPDARRAWHAGTHNATHWGIELEQGIETDGFTAPQMASLIEVCRTYVALGVPARHAFDGFIGHDETPQGRASGKSDPGFLFNWSKLVTALTPHADGWFPEPPYQVLYNSGVPVLRIGGELPGQISKLFGDRYLWLGNEDGTAVWRSVPSD
jgi:N-acetyl-anhydromuramyl-L-alanine amidase AmpD